MTENREFNAASVDEALNKAAAQLGVSSDELSYEVLDEGSSGFLGIGARDARVSVQGSFASEAAPVEPEQDAVEEPASSLDPTEPALEEAVLPEPAESEEDAVEHEAAPEDLLKETGEQLASILDAMGFEARVDVYDAGEFIAGDVTSENAALFIGQKGETIDALQYLLNASIYRNRPFVKRIILDSEGYRQRRVEAVQGIAHRTARRAIREARTVELPPMNSSERRIVHMYLKDNPGVSTASEGNGDNRRVKISPA